ncbi:HERV-H_2q24.3 provirus ancestral Env polyprotein [Danio aesculapii]|uniref:HERV-H_2q24.3 provirus ancestral Env polyprotein n=1 Tax=Danio aesculapii TaxID=1142201 RepID=UPI0024BF6108|nr:HERV-H_2q24.3 provirus ancestral Env polyprotein [Danio aesculapii]
MPHSAKQNTLYGKPMNKTQAKCYASFAGCGYQDPQIQINDSDIDRIGLKKGTCDSMFWVKFNHTSQGRPIGHKVFFNHTLKHPMCYNQTNGTIYMGSTLNCEQIWRSGEGAPVSMSGPSNGTYVVQGGWWLCRRTAFMSLPANWIGQCAPIHVTDRMFIMAAVPGAESRRRRRSVPTFVPHDPIWGEDVPDEFKLWSTSNKVTLSLFPHIGVGKVMLRLETLDYRLGLFINASQIIDKAQNKEISNIRTMVMQNKMALNLLTASGGGVCVLLNTTCCTYISDDINSDAMRDALGTLTKLKNAMTADYRPDHNGGWNIFHNLFGWVTPFISMMIPIIVVVLLICCCGPCLVCIMYNESCLCYH